MTVFNTTINDFTRKYLIKTPGIDEAPLVATFHSEYEKTLAEIIEQFLFFDKVAINVYGENIGLVVLINELGLHQVLSLIEEDAIEFLLWTPMLMTTTNDDLVGKVNPLVSGNASSPVHCDPLESVKMGLRSWKKQPDRRVRRDLEKKFSKIYKIPSPKFVHNAAEIVTSAYNTNKLADFGLPKQSEAIWLELNDRNKLLKLGDDILKSTILSDLNYSSFGRYRTYSLTQQSFRHVKNANLLLDGINEIFKTEHLPNVNELIRAKKITLNELVNLRRKSTSKKFRSWLVANSVEDSKYIVKEYIDEIANHKGFFEKNVGKFIKTVGMWGIGGVIGGALGGIQGSVYGISTAAFLQPVGELGLSFIDTYFLEGLQKGWQPKLFINEYEKIALEVERQDKNTRIDKNS